MATEKPKKKEQKIDKDDSVLVDYVNGDGPLNMQRVKKSLHDDLYRRRLERQQNFEEGLNELNLFEDGEY